MINIKNIILVTIITLVMFPTDVKAEEVERTKMEQGLKEYIEDVCEDYNICPDLIIAIAERESSLRYDVVSSAGCVGLMQISPKWHKERRARLGVTDLLDPKQNVLVAIDFIAELFEKYEDLYAVLMFYNGGYGEKYGLRAFERGDISKYAIGISKRSTELQEIREYDEIMEEKRKLFSRIRRAMIWKNCEDLKLGVNFR